MARNENFTCSDDDEVIVKVATGEELDAARIGEGEGDENEEEERGGDKDKEAEEKEKEKGDEKKEEAKSEDEVDNNQVEDYNYYSEEDKKFEKEMKVLKKNKGY